jgi:hypothetical protein
MDIVDQPGVRTAPTTATVPVEAPQDFYFTFGYDHVHPVTGESLADRYVQLHGTYRETRDRIIAAFARQWSFQYGPAQAEWAVFRYNLRPIDLPEPLGVGSTIHIERYGEEHIRWLESRSLNISRCAWVVVRRRNGELAMVFARSDPRPEWLVDAARRYAATWMAQFVPPALEPVADPGADLAAELAEDAARDQAPERSAR